MGKRKSPQPQYNAAPLQTVTQTQAPWEPQQRYIMAGLGHAENFMQNYPRKFYPGSTVAEFAPETEQALQGVTQRATRGSPLMRGAQSEIANTLQGNYLYGGPGFNAAIEAAQNKILPAVQSRFLQAGRSRGGLAQQAATSAIADAFANQYGEERTNQMRAAMFAPGLAQQDYLDLSQLADVGAAREELTQEKINEARQRHDFEQSEYANRIQQYLNMIQGNYGGSTTGQIPIQPTMPVPKRNRMAGILQGAGSGAAMGSMAGPWGAVIGGVGGGLLGAFS
jgi:hypothetical protein